MKRAKVKFTEGQRRHAHRQNNVPASTAGWSPDRGVGGKHKQQKASPAHPLELRFAMARAIESRVFEAAKAASTLIL